MTTDNKLTKAPISEFTAEKQSMVFRSVKKNQFTGKLIIQDNQRKTWIFYLYLGRIIYATGGYHSVRRYRRAIINNFPELIPDLVNLERNHLNFSGLELKVCWEYELLSNWQKQDKITRERINLLVRSIVTEVLFDLSQSKQVTIEIENQRFLLSPLVLLDPEQLIADAWMLWQNWQGAKIADRSPNSAPIISQPEKLAKTSPKTYQQMVKIFDGTKSLRDIATNRQQDVVQLTCWLLPYIQLGLIDLVEIPDLNPPVDLPKQENQQHYLIACIDENKFVCKKTEEILRQNGYNFVGINDDLRAIALLLNYKPDLVLVSLTMTHTNGYEVCRQLRRVTQFSQIPIIITTENLGVIDRIKGKLVGCSDFLSKPIESKPLMFMLDKHLEQVKTKIS